MTDCTCKHLGRFTAQCDRCALAAFAQALADAAAAAQAAAQTLTATVARIRT